jgi:peptide/nickel transport system ATP-binding protein
MTATAATTAPAGAVSGATPTGAVPTGAAVPLIAVEALVRRFSSRPDFAARIAHRLGAPNREWTVHAVDGVDLSVGEGEAVGLVGESGCGKSTLGRVIAGIDQPTAGRILYRGADVAGIRGEAARRIALNVQMIFQDPLSSLNPRMRMGDIVAEAPRFHRVVPDAELTGHVDTVLRQAGLDPSLKDRYPHQFSGGQRQRIGVARALAVRPELIVCDEAVAALDVSIQAQIINLFMRLRQDLGLALLFISHDIGVVRHLCDRVAVMYLGRIVEEGPTADLFAAPQHPYTRTLLSAVPRLDLRHARFTSVKGEIPSPIAPPPGCHFHPRCPIAVARCRTEKPPLVAVGAGRRAACFLADGATP